jgi:hypothetical protein
MAFLSWRVDRGRGVARSRSFLYTLRARWYQSRKRRTVFEPLLDSIVEDYRAGNKNILRLANRAISRFEMLPCEVPWYEIA